MNKALELFKLQIGKDASHSPSPLMQWLNPILISATAGELEFSYVIREEMTNPLGIGSSPCLHDSEPFRRLF